MIGQQLLSICNLAPQRIVVGTQVLHEQLPDDGGTKQPSHLRLLGDGSGSTAVRTISIRPPTRNSIR